MSTPTDQQRIRANLRKAMMNMGATEAAHMAVVEAATILGMGNVSGAAMAWLDMPQPAAVPPLMGTAEVAAAFGIANSNISKLPEAVRPCPVTRISNGTTPVYLASEVTAKAAQYRPRTRATT